MMDSKAIRRDIPDKDEKLAGSTPLSLTGMGLSETAHNKPFRKSGGSSAPLFAMIRDGLLFIDINRGKVERICCVVDKSGKVSNPSRMLHHE